MIKLAVVMINAGVEFWNEYTERAVHSLSVHSETPYELIVVDNGGKGRGQVNIDVMVPYAEAVNRGVQAISSDASRILILNNDIIANGKWQTHLCSHQLCGPVILRKEGIDYIEGWAISIDRDLWHMLGGFNEIYKNSWEDVDLSWRASRLGIYPKRIDLPLYHVWGATRNKIPGSNQWDFDNRKYLLDRIAASKDRRWKPKG